jgi:hypothetical protein
MATTETRPILIKNEDIASDGTLYLCTYDNRDRFKRAAKAWIGCWIGAVLCVPLIGLHWFLVPGFIIAGPIMAYKRYHAMATSEKAAGVCPVCHNDITIPLEPKERPELWKYCPSCNSPLHLIDKNDTSSTGAA